VAAGQQFCLRRVSLSSVTWHGSVVLGWATIVLAIVHLASASSMAMVPGFVMMAALVVLLEALPLVQGRGHDPQGVVMSTAFVCALLFVWGAYPAVVLLAIGSVAADMRAGKNWWKVAFNPAQYALSVASAWGVMLAFGKHPTLSHPLSSFQMRDLIWMVLSWVAYFVVNLALVASVVSWSTSFLSTVLDDLWHNTVMTFAVLSLSPLITALAPNQWDLIPLLLVPLLLIYYTAQVSLAREHEAAHDGLTGLPNRTSLQYSLEEAFDAYRRNNLPFALMLIDMDDFKSVNDTLGHQIGDDLLRLFADRLATLVRPGDLVARLGGDEFAVVVHNASIAEATAVAERIVASSAEPVSLEGLPLEVALSVGIAACPDHGVDAATLLRHADVAMYAAKKDHTGTRVYAGDQDDNDTTRLGMLAELRRALDSDQIELLYQPKLSMQDRTPIGVEALIRWRHPERGHIPPDQFVPMAERSGIMPRLTERVVDIALRQLAEWRARGIFIPVAVNVSPTDLAGGELSSLVARRLDEYNVPADMLKLEITERIATYRLDEARATLSELSRLGVSISLDDFGTGYSSLARLSSIPVDEIKIDRAFVSRLVNGTRDAGIVGAMIDLAHALGVPSIAEGVETAEEWRCLHALGCDGAQGWYIARPMSGDQFSSWVSRAVDPQPSTEDGIGALAGV
jgi:diguanylate cyclase (GGDEF)-like protein